MQEITAGSTSQATQPSPADRQTRRRSALRKNSAGICVMLLVQYGLGMGVNLYARVPAADRGAGLAASLGRVLTSQPAILAVHAAVGLLMLVAGVTVLTRAVLTRHALAIAASAAGLAGIVAAAVTGDAFVSSGGAGASMAMAVLTGVALLCYLATLLLAGPPATTRERPR
ncbi:MAG TPA: hypothetical protein VFX25_19290 [Streptosporangiaceae bacterium]|nr:hypothetical protein [Streptosporangiaceae bacterium]